MKKTRNWVGVVLIVICYFLMNGLLVAQTPPLLDLFDGPQGWTYSDIINKNSFTIHNTVPLQTTYEDFQYPSVNPTWTHRYNFQVVKCEYESGPYQMVSHSNFENQYLHPENFTYDTIDIRDRAVFYIPVGWPASSENNCAIIYNVHQLNASLQPHVNYRLEAYEIVERCGIPVVIIGSSADTGHNWMNLGYSGGQNQIVAYSGMVVALANENTTENYRRHWFYSLMRSNLVAVSLVREKLKAIHPQGHDISGVALRGYSKQGASCWKLGVLQHPLIKGLLPGNNHLIGAGSTYRYMYDWGDPTQGYDWFDCSCAGGSHDRTNIYGGGACDRAKWEASIQGRFALAEYTASSETPEAGFRFGEIYGLNGQIDFYKNSPLEFVSVAGEVANMRDYSGERLHDRQFCLGSESVLLERLRSESGFPEVRYARMKPDKDNAPTMPPGQPIPHGFWNCIEAAQQLKSLNMTRWPKVHHEVAAATQIGADRYLDSTAYVALGQSNYSVDSVEFYYSVSKSNRIWNDEEQDPSQNGIPNPTYREWKSVSMVQDLIDPCRYDVPQVNITQACPLTNSLTDYAIAWYVEVRGKDSVDSYVYDSSPPKFIHLENQPVVSTGCTNLEITNFECLTVNPQANTPVTFRVTYESEKRLLPWILYPNMPYFKIKVNTVYLWPHCSWTIGRSEIPEEGSTDQLEVSTVFTAPGQYTVGVWINPQGYGNRWLPESEKGDNYGEVEILVN